MVRPGLWVAWMGVLAAATTARAAGPADVPPPAPQEMLFAPQMTAAAGVDVVTTDDGHTWRGRIVDELPHGYLVRTADGTTVVVPYAHVVDVVRPSAAVDLPAAEAPAVTPPPATVALPGREELVSEAMGGPRWKSESRSAALAYLFETFLPGAGLMYAGSIAEGIAHLMLITLIPGILCGGAGCAFGALTVINASDPKGLQTVMGLGLGIAINLFMILSAAVLSARVGSILRAGPAATQHNQRLLGDLVREARVEAWAKSAHPPEQPPPPPHNADEDPGVVEEELD